MLQQTVRRLTYFLAHHLRYNFVGKRYGFHSLYTGRKWNSAKGDLEKFFITNDQRQIPVYRNYRYLVKPIWHGCKILTLIHEILQKGVLSSKEEMFFKNAFGHRTLTQPFPEIRERILALIPRFRHLLIPSSLHGDVPIVAPSIDCIQKIIQEYYEHHISPDIS